MKKGKQGTFPQNVGGNKVPEKPLESEGKEVRMGQNLYSRPVWRDSYDLLKEKERRDSETFPFEKIGKSLWQLDLECWWMEVSKDKQLSIATFTHVSHA